MNCPQCHCSDSRVIESRPAEGGAVIRRRRVCEKCDFRFTTYERVETSSVAFVRKKDGRREGFKRDKLLCGIARACDKLPVSMQTLEELVDRVEKQVFSEGEMSSEHVGDLVMAELKKLHKVAYVRFAAVYREFKDLHELQREIHKLLNDEINK